MPRRITGRYELPPLDPPIVMDELITERHRKAEQALIRLEVAGEMAPSLDWFIYAFVRKEAVLSSQIEGTQATLVDLLSFEAQARGEEQAPPNADVEEICNYLEALTYARAQLADAKGLPLSMRLLNETHRRLMRGSRPGNAACVPPPPQALGSALGSFEKYLHESDALPPLVRAGLLHVQFETIHPYLDGNGRIGRLLVTLLLEHWGLLKKPLLYLSLFFKRHRNDYYHKLNEVRVEGDWESWLLFFLDGVATIADEAVETARDLSALVSMDRARVLAQEGASIAVLRLFEQLPRHPILTSASVMKLVETTKPTAGRAIDLLVSAGVLRETTGKKRDRSFVYEAYLDRLRVGTELEFIRSHPRD